MHAYLRFKISEEKTQTHAHAIGYWPDSEWNVTAVPAGDGRRVLSYLVYSRAPAVAWAGAPTGTGMLSGIRPAALSGTQSPGGMASPNASAHCETSSPFLPPGITDLRGSRLGW